MKQTMMLSGIAVGLLALLVGCEEASIQGTRTGWLENDISGVRGEMQVELSATPRLYLEAWPDGQEELKFATKPKRIVPVTEWGIYEVYILDGGLTSDVATFQVLLENDHTCYPLLTVVDVQRTYYSKAKVEVVSDIMWDGVVMRVDLPLEDGTTRTYFFKQDDEGNVSRVVQSVPAL